MKRTLFVIFLALVISGFAYLGIITAIDKGKQSAIDQTLPAQEQMLGGDRDEHGCIPSAGFIWCDEKQKCLRTFEEPCLDAPSPSDAPSGE